MDLTKKRYSTSTHIVSTLFPPIFQCANYLNMDHQIMQIKK